jgi:hypothetical protein
MSNLPRLNQLKLQLNELGFKRALDGYPQARWFTTPKIIQFSKEELKDLWHFAKVRCITICVIDKDKVYKLNKKGELELL